MFKKTSKKDELERQQTQLLTEVSQLKKLVESLRTETERYREALLDAAPLLDRYEKTAELIREQVALTNHAQAARYSELKKRLDSYDQVFKQLGIVIQKQPA